MTRKGQLIVLEGVDGAGTTTQTERLRAAIAARHAAQHGAGPAPVHATREPSGGPIGALLRQALTGRWVTPDPAGARAPGWSTLALLFAADRLDHLEVEVTPRLAAGVTVVSDRYYHSSVAYQSLSAGPGPHAIPWIRELNRHARQPDLTLVLDVPDDVAAQRRAARGGRELFDDAALQSRLAEFYARLEQHFPGERIVHVRGDASPDAVASDVLAAVDAL
jgi:dTMP kinase